MKKYTSVLFATTLLVAGCSKKDKEKELEKAVAEQPEQTVFSKAQVAAIEQIVHKYVVNNPTVLAESIMNLQKQVADKQQEKVLELLKQNKADLDKTAGIPVLGAASADVTVVMFGDYTDARSKAMFKMFENVMAKDKQFKVVYRFLPDTSASAQKAARIAIAMNNQGLFDKFHAKVLSTPEMPTETLLMDIAANIPGVNRAKLESDVDAAATKEAVLNNRQVAGKLEINQAPGYVIGDFLLKQPISPQDLDMVIAKLREKK